MIGLSIIVPFYNAYSTFNRLYVSILSQQASNLRYEIIVIDDCSDDSGNKDYFGLYRGVEVIRLPENSGPLNARMTGARKAKYSHILFVDADDELESDFFKAVEPYLAEENSFILFCGRRDDGSLFGNIRSTDGALLKKESLCVLFLNSKAGFSGCKIINSFLAKNVDISSFPRMLYLEDSFLTLKFFSKTKLGAYYVNKPLLRWHTTQNSLSRRFDVSFFDCLCTVAMEKKKMIDQNADVFDSPYYADVLNSWFCESLCEIYCGCLRKEKKTDSLAKLKAIRQNNTLWPMVVEAKGKFLSAKAAFFRFCYKTKTLWLFSAAAKINAALKRS